MEQKFGKNSIDIKVLREFCEREGKMVEYRKGEQLEREGDPARWFGFVTDGCFKYVTHGISDDKEHITWFSFEGEFAGDYPACLDGGPALTTIEAMVPTRIIRVSGEQLVKRFSQDKKSMDLRCLIAEHLLSQARVRYTDLHRATPLERYHAPRTLRVAAPPLPGHRPPSPPECHRLVPLRHSPTVVTHPQGRHVFGEIIPNIHKTSEHLFRLSPRQIFFRSCRGLFRGTFCNFVAQNE